MFGLAVLLLVADTACCGSSVVGKRDQRNEVVGLRDSKFVELEVAQWGLGPAVAFLGDWLVPLTGDAVINKLMLRKWRTVTAVTGLDLGEPEQHLGASQTVVGDGFLDGHCDGLWREGKKYSGGTPLLRWLAVPTFRRFRRIQKQQAGDGLANWPVPGQPVASPMY